MNKFTSTRSNSLSSSIEWSWESINNRTQYGSNTTTLHNRTQYGSNTTTLREVENQQRKHSSLVQIQYTTHFSSKYKLYLSHISKCICVFFKLYLSEKEGAGGAVCKTTPSSHSLTQTVFEPYFKMYLCIFSNCI